MKLLQTETAPEKKAYGTAALIRPPAVRAHTLSIVVYCRCAYVPVITMRHGIKDFVESGREHDHDHACPCCPATLFPPHLDLVDEALWRPLGPNHQDACVLVKLHPTPFRAEPKTRPDNHTGTHAFKTRHTHVC